MVTLNANCLFIHVIDVVILVNLISSHLDVAILVNLISSHFKLILLWKYIRYFKRRNVGVFIYKFCLNNLKNISLYFNYATKTADGKDNS